MKKCSICKETKPFSEFHKANKEKDGYQYRCKQCCTKMHKERYQKDKIKILEQTKKWKTENKDKANETANKWREKNKDKVKGYQRKTNIRKFGISELEYDQMFVDQEGKCAICGCEETYIHHATQQKANLAIDHCHTNGHVRGLLCKACNNALGLFKDNPELLRKAADYLEKE